MKNTKNKSSAIDSKWRERAVWRKENKQWLRNSQKIAIAILNHLDKNNMNQDDFASRLGVTQQYVSKILRGSENLSLETISKIETALNIELISIIPVSYDGSIVYEMETTSEYMK
jgi:transcriptional regulator with XRE-family HTH domain